MTGSPRYQAGDVIGETTTDGGRLVEVLHVGQEAYFVRHLGGLGAFDGIPGMEPLETAWAFESCENATYLHERPTADSEGKLTVCPTPCDDDCTTACHETHQPGHKRDHEPDTCPEQHTYRPGCQIAPDWRKRP